MASLQLSHSSNLIHPQNLTRHKRNLIGALIQSLGTRDVQWKFSETFILSACFPFSGTLHCIMCEDHGNNIVINLVSIPPLCYLLLIMMSELCHYSHWSYWQLVLYNESFQSYRSWCIIWFCIFIIIANCWVLFFIFFNVAKNYHFMCWFWSSKCNTHDAWWQVLSWLKRRNTVGVTVLPPKRKSRPEISEVSSVRKRWG